MRLIDADALSKTIKETCLLAKPWDYVLIERTIADAPTIEPEQRWIPCNERMPETTDYYLIQYSRHICQDEMAVAFYSVEEAELDKNYTWEFKSFTDLKEVIAWMPLPEPYNAERRTDGEETDRKANHFKTVDIYL